jgi:CRISPR-associated protein Cas4
METKKLLNVTDLSAYLFCARKFYLEKVKGLKAPVNKAMIEGSIRHKVLEEFSIQEEKLVESFGSVSKKEIVEKFLKLLELIVKKVFSQNAESIQKFEIDIKEFYKKIFDAMENDILLRAGSIDDATRKGFTGKDLWTNLEPKYISEMELISEELGLKGRADRVMISESSIIPFELKTRLADKVWPSDEIQLTCYSMMLEEKYGNKIPLGILEAGNKKHEIIIDEKKKKEDLKLIEEVKEILEGKNLKFPSSFSKCQTCPWKKECEEL